MECNFHDRPLSNPLWSEIWAAMLSFFLIEFLNQCVAIELIIFRLIQLIFPLKTILWLDDSANFPEAPAGRSVADVDSSPSRTKIGGIGRLVVVVVSVVDGEAVVGIVYLVGVVGAVGDDDVGTRVVAPSHWASDVSSRHTRSVGVPVLRFSTASVVKESSLAVVVEVVLSVVVIASVLAVMVVDGNGQAGQRQSHWQWLGSATGSIGPR